MIRFLLLVASASLFMRTDALEIIGHRGASYDAPENTLSAFKLSYEQGADATELDVHLSKDNRVVVLHDVDLKRVCGVPLKAAETTLSELQKHNVTAFGKWKDRGLDERAPSLDDALKTVPPGKRLFVEIKCREEILPALAECFGKSTLKPQQLPIITFHYEVAAAAKKRFPEHEVSWLHSWSKDKPNPTVEELIRKAKDAGLDGLDLNYGFPIDKAFVEKVHAAGLKLYTWTVDDADIAGAEADAGVDGITTNRPEWLRERLNNRELQQGASFPVGDRVATVAKLDALPFVQDEYTKRFKFDSFDNPKLKSLREQYGLDAVIAEGKDEFEKQVLLNDWVHRRFKKFGRPTSSARGALEILQGIDRGDAFFCAQYAELMVSAAASLGWIDRVLALRRHQGVNARGGSTEHSTTEIWSNQFAKWVMLDPTSNMYLEKDGIPLNAWEIRQEWFYHGGTNLTFVIGREKKRYRKADLPIYLEHFAGFGDLTIEPDELDKYGFIGYIPNTNLMDSGNDYAQMFIVKDDLCAGTKWHVRALPKDPARDPYFPINQGAIELLPGQDDTIEVALRTFTPNFKSFEVRVDDAPVASSEKVSWKLHAGRNQLQARAVNSFGVKGPPSTIVIEVE